MQIPGGESCNHQCKGVSSYLWLCAKSLFSLKNGCEGSGYAMVWEWRLGRED